MRSALAESTWNTYRTRLRHYVRFCRQMRFAALPFNIDVVELFVTSLSFSVSTKTIKIYLSGIQTMAKLAGYRGVGLSDMPTLPYLIQGIRRIQGSRFRRPRRSPMTFTHLRQLVGWVRRSHGEHDSCMLVAATTLAFFGLLRVSEYTSPTTSRYDPEWHLLVSDVTVNAVRRLAYVRIKASKTDPFRESAIVRVGVSGSELCPVSALVRYLRVRRRGVGPLFVFRDGRFLTRRHMVSLIGSALGVGVNLNTHSFRIGGASALANAGVPAYQIQLIGRWKSDAFLEYIRLSDSYVSETAARMSQGD